MTTERLLTPSKITAWLDCDHYLTLRHRVDEGLMAKPDSTFGSMAQLLADKGIEHETDCLAGYRAEGLSVFEVPAQDRERGESFAGWVDRVGNPMADGHDVIYQMPFVYDGVRGIADFLIRVDDAATGTWGYEPVDAKLARTAAKPGHVLQLCFYADAIEALTGHRARHIHLWLGSGRIETILADDFRPYWRRLRGRLTELMDQERRKRSPMSPPSPSWPSVPPPRAQAINEQLTHALHSRITIEQAKAMVAQETSANMEEAFKRLRAHARNHNLRLVDLAGSIVEGTVQAAALDPIPHDRTQDRSPRGPRR